MHVPGEDWVQQSAFALALVAEGIAVVVIAFAIVVSTWRTIRAVGQSGAAHPWSDVRLDLARWLALSLEFLLAADIARTAVAPEWSDIARLAAIAVIRTGLNYFLERDIEQARKSENRPPSGTDLRNGAPG